MLDAYKPSVDLDYLSLRDKRFIIIIAKYFRYLY